MPMFCEELLLGGQGSSISEIAGSHGHRSKQTLAMQKTAKHVAILQAP